jgi:hypothetical protein
LPVREAVEESEARDAVEALRGILDADGLYFF